MTLEKASLISKYAPLIEKYRYIGVEHDWYDYIIDEAVENFAKIGFKIDERTIYWQLNCQGAGFAIGGWMSDGQAFLASNPEFATLFPTLMKAAELNGHSNLVRCTISPHSRFMTFNIDHEWIDYDVLFDYTGLQRDVAEAVGLRDKYEKECDAMEEFTRCAVQEICDSTHRELDAEYTHLTSNEAVYDMLEANDMLGDQEEAA